MVPTTEPLTYGASLLTGDTLEFSVRAENDSTVRIEIVKEEWGGRFSRIALTSQVEIQVSIDFEADGKGFYSYTVEFTEGSGEVVVDVDRKLLIDFIIYPLGIVCLIFGISQEKG